MDFSEYQKESRKTAIYPSKDLASVFSYLALGLCGESGEVAEKIKKLLRDKNGEMTPEDKEAIALELGDVLWYITQFAHEIEKDLETIAQLNIVKLHSRLKRDALHGSGDHR